VTRTRSYRKWGLWWTFAGAALFAYLIYHTGVVVIYDNVRFFGWNFSLLILITGARQFMRAFAWRYCFEPPDRNVGLVELFRIRLLGEAVSDLTFAGPVLGETAKVMAIGKRVSLTSSLSSVVIENLIFSLAVILFVLSGVLVMLSRVALPGSLQLAGLLTAMGLCLPLLVAYIFVKRRWLIITNILRWFETHDLKWAFLARREERLKQFEGNVYGFYGKHPALSIGLTAVELASNLTNVIEAYLILGALTGSYSWTIAYLIETVNRVINAAFALVPLQIGVDEGGTALALKGLGFDSGVGVSLAIIRKVRILFWVGIGLIIAAQFSLSMETFRSGLGARGEEV
jgi:uncharacterized membrane protein YbhN (UPF0104 family)